MPSTHLLVSHGIGLFPNKRRSYYYYYYYSAAPQLRSSYRVSAGPPWGARRVAEGRLRASSMPPKRSAASLQEARGRVGRRDAHDRERFHEAKKELDSLLSCEEVRSQPRGPRYRMRRLPGSTRARRPPRLTGAIARFGS